MGSRDLHLQAALSFQAVLLAYADLACLLAFAHFPSHATKPLKHATLFHSRMHEHRHKLQCHAMQVSQRGGPGTWYRGWLGSRQQITGFPPMRVRIQPPGWSCTSPTMCACSACSTTPSPMATTGPATSGMHHCYHLAHHTISTSLCPAIVTST